MSREYVFEEQPLRCMANYYDYGPTTLTSHDTATNGTNTTHRSIPGRMANYAETRFDHVRKGYRELQEHSHQPEKHHQVCENLHLMAPRKVNPGLAIPPTDGAGDIVRAEQ